jgi:hypothetical protein
MKVFPPIGSAIRVVAPLPFRASRYHRRKGVVLGHVPMPIAQVEVKFPDRKEPHFYVLTEIEPVDLEEQIS